MKNKTILILLGLLLAACARADTPLTITTFPTLESCLYNNIVLFVIQPAASGSFTLNGVNGSGVVQSDVSGFSPYPPYNTEYVFNYAIDMSGMSPVTNHCVKLVIHFGPPDGCNGPAVAGSPSQIQSATLSPLGDITFEFGGGCLQPGQSAISFGMLSDAPGFKTNMVTIIDDYYDQASGMNKETRINVPAIVPAVPPNPPPWVYAPQPIPYPFYQGILYTNQYNPPTNRFGTLGAYDFTVQLYNAPSNGMALSQVFTQTVQVVNGLFNLPLPFDPAAFGSSSRWLSFGVRPAGSNIGFTPLNPPQALTPTPQALYAYSAGVVADLTPGQAVTSLNGLTDAVNLQAGSGIILGRSGNTLTISAQPGVPSDRNLKTDFTTAQPEDILTKLVALPITEWRYTNEEAGVRHVGPMAQDFKAAFGLGHDSKMIEFVDEEGVALAAIKGLNEKVESENAALWTENAELKARLARLEKMIPATSKKP
jgi:hypothetical protein